MQTGCLAFADGSLTTIMLSPSVEGCAQRHALDAGILDPDRPNSGLQYEANGTHSIVFIGFCGVPSARTDRPDVPSRPACLITARSVFTAVSTTATQDRGREQQWSPFLPVRRDARFSGCCRRHAGLVSTTRQP